MSALGVGGVEEPVLSLVIKRKVVHNVNRVSVCQYFQLRYQNYSCSECHQYVRQSEYIKYSKLARWPHHSDYSTGWTKKIPHFLRK